MKNDIHKIFNRPENKWPDQPPVIKQVIFLTDLPRLWHGKCRYPSEINKVSEHGCDASTSPPKTDTEIRATDTQNGCSDY